MPLIGIQTSHSDARCERCNSKRREAKKWVEKIKTEYGTTVIQHAQIICVNKECQAKFEKVLIEDEKKREVLRDIRSKESAKRKSARLTK